MFGKLEHALWTWWSYFWSNSRLIRNRMNFYKTFFIDGKKSIVNLIVMIDVASFLQFNDVWCCFLFESKNFLDMIYKKTLILFYILHQRFRFTNTKVQSLKKRRTKYGLILLRFSQITLRIESIEYYVFQTFYLIISKSSMNWDFTMYFKQANHLIR